MFKKPDFYKNINSSQFIIINKSPPKKIIKHIK